MPTGWRRARRTRRPVIPTCRRAHYRFRVTACNNDGHWNAAGAQVSFCVVLPHFLANPVVHRPACFVSLLGLTAGGIRYLERRRYQSAAQTPRIAERRTERERARIARDLHDELGSSLTRISMLSDLAQSPDNNAEQLTSRVEKISGFAVRTARSLDEIVWAVNPRNDSLRSLLEYLTQFARELFEDTSIHCRFHIPEDLPRSPLPPEMRHNIFLAVKEALTNVLKHARAREVSLRAQIAGQQLEISVQDDGAGFDPALLEAANFAHSGLRKHAPAHRKSWRTGLSFKPSPGQSTTITISLQLSR